MADGDGLYLSVSKTGAKSWRFIYKRASKRTELGLGSYGSGTEQVTLAAARDKADSIRLILGAGGDPKASPVATKPSTTFGQCADDFIAAMESSWRNPKHRQQWKNTLATHGKSLRKIPVADVSTDDVLKVLRPIWATRPETATRIRGRIEKVLDAAKARGLRTGENPARWRGHLDLMLPPARKLTRGHHPALPYAELPDFLITLRQQPGLAAQALEFTILTGSRSGEMLGAVWDEIDIEGALWTIPADRMKSSREHRVPLVSRSIEILEAMKKVRVSDFIFPGRVGKKPMSDMTITAVLRRMKRDDITVHGFRSTFRDWVSDCTDHPRELAEAALAHIVGEETERAYRRGDALEKRRALMRDWADYCGSGSDGEAA
jgi:integrase